MFYFLLLFFRGIDILMSFLMESSRLNCLTVRHLTIENHNIYRFDKSQTINIPLKFNKAF